MCTLLRGSSEVLTSIPNGAQTQTLWWDGVVDPGFTINNTSFAPFNSLRLSPRCDGGCIIHSVRSICMCVCVCRVFSFHHGRKQEQIVDLKKTKAKAKKKSEFFFCALCVLGITRALVNGSSVCLSLARAQKWIGLFFFTLSGRKELTVGVDLSCLRCWMGVWKVPLARKVPELPIHTKFRIAIEH